MESSEIDQLIQNLDALYTSPSPDLSELSEILRRLTDCSKHEGKRSAVQTLNESHWHVLVKVAAFSATLLNREQRISNIEWDFMADLLRCLRNCCAGCYCDDQLPMSVTDLLSVALNFLKPLLKQRQNASAKETVLLRCCLQLFGNLVCQSNNSKHFVWKFFTQEGIFQHLLEDRDPKTQEYCMMILYNCMIPEYQQQILNTDEGHKILLSLMDTLCENFIDWGYLLTESIVGIEDFMETGYTILPIRSRLLVLDVIAEQVEGMESNKCISEAMLHYIKQLFIDYVLDIVKTCESYSGDLKSIEITKLLSILCSASIGSKSSYVIKTYNDLLEVAIEILKSVHLLGKKSSNAFSTVSNLKDMHNLSREDVEMHPSFGFKKNLIRLIGNMCSQCRQNQDTVRKMDGIPLLLDCCNLDVRNPYIMQWCIFSIRNIMENNPDNQAILAGISVTEEMASSTLLKELGLTVELENGTPVLKAASSKAL